MKIDDEILKLNVKANNLLVGIRQMFDLEVGDLRDIDEEFKDQAVSGLETFIEDLERALDSVHYLTIWADDGE